MIHWTRFLTLAGACVVSAAWVPALSSAQYAQPYCPPNYRVYPVPGAVAPAPLPLGTPAPTAPNNGNVPQSSTGPAAPQAVPQTDPLTIPQSGQDMQAGSQPDAGLPSLAAGAFGGESVAVASNVGYIDSAIPRTQIRVRFDSAWDNNAPDRAEFFYPKCGCFRLAGADPNAFGPPMNETNVSYQDLSASLEVAANEWLSGFIELPFRFLNPEQNVNVNGLADINLGFKAALWADECRYVTFQFRTYLPTGDSDRGLGTNNVNIEPALLFLNRLSDRLTLEAELRDWIALGGTDFSGNVLRYGIGGSYAVIQNDSFSFSPVVEFVGWTVLNGRRTNLLVPGGSVNAGGDTIFNAKFGVRANMGESQSLYVGYGRPLTGEIFYEDILRAEYRITF